MTRPAHRLLQGLTALSLLALLAAMALWVRGYTHGPDVCVSGYWHYTPHPGYPQILDAWQVRLINTPNRWIASAHRRACVCGPGRGESWPGQNRRLLDFSPPDADGIVEGVERSLWQYPGARGAAGVRYLSWRYDHALAVPHAIAAGLFALLPASYLPLARLRRRRRIRRGLCPACGYDLRATPVQGGPLLRCCPECGLERAGRPGV